MLKIFFIISPLILFAVPNANAGPFEDLRRGVENALPVSTRSIKCEQIRSDANDHQARINSDIYSRQRHLEKTLVDIENYTQFKQSNEERNTTLNQQLILLEQMKTVNMGFVSNEASLRSALSNLRTSTSNQVFNDTLHSMENDPKNLHVRKLASIFQNLNSKRDTELQAIIKNGQARALFQQLSVLINNSKVLLIQEQSYLNAEYVKFNVILTVSYSQKITLE